MVQTLRIRWSKDEIEYIKLSDLRKGGTTETLALWPGHIAKRVNYSARVIDIHQKAEWTHAELRYELSLQKDKHANEQNDVHDGVLSLTWSAREKVGSGIWKGDSRSDYDGKGKGKIMGGLRLDASRRKLNLTARPRRDRLRNDMLFFDGCCVLTKEGQIEALEVAHVIDVKGGGNDVPANLILLRADLHRLFDARLLNFKITKSGARAHFHESVSPLYRSMQGVPLSSDTFSRVREALALRAKMLSVGGK